MDIENAYEPYFDIGLTFGLAFAAAGISITLVPLGMDMLGLSLHPLWIAMLLFTIVLASAVPTLWVDRIAPHFPPRSRILRFVLFLLQLAFVLGWFGVVYLFVG